MSDKIPYWKNRNIESMDGEIWVAINGYEGLYDVSNFGRVKSLSRVVPHKTSHTKTVQEKILKLYKDLQGYLIATLYKNNKCFHGLVHRIVAISFIENPNNLPEVNHKWGNKEDNRVSELNWTTASDNQKHSYDVLMRSRFVPSGISNPHSKKVRCTTLDIDFGSVKIAGEQLGISASAISMVCNGVRRHTQALVFKYI